VFDSEIGSEKNNEEREASGTEETVAEAGAGPDGDSESADAPIGGDDLFFDLPEEDQAEEEVAEADLESAEPAVEGLSGEDDLLEAVSLELSAEEQAEIERRGRMKWYVIHANTGHENKVKRNIEMAIKSNYMEDFFGEVLVVI
jgi:transcription termination factor NusG